MPTRPPATRAKLSATNHVQHNLPRKGLTTLYNHQLSLQVSTGLQITVSHRTMADPNLSMSNEIPTVVGHNVRKKFFLPTNAN